MKKEEILKLFPVILDEEIKDLPNELVVCWYPSSGTGCDSETLYRGYGYNILDHWKQQPSNFKPNLFIFSDIDGFDLPDESEVLFNRSFFEHPVINFLNNPITVDYDLIPDDHYIHESERYIKDLGRLFDLGLVDENEWMSKFENPRSPAENEIYKLEIKLLLDAGVFPKDKIVEELKEKEFIHVEEGLFGPVKTLSIISYLETFFILVQTTNKYIHNHFLDLNFKIPLLAMNRPNDSFLVEDGIDYKGLGVKEFIVGHCGFGENKSFPEEYFKHPDFVFQTRGDENNYFEDLANLYSLKQS